MDVYEDIEKAKKIINYSKFTHMGYNLIYPYYRKLKWLHE